MLKYLYNLYWKLPRFQPLFAGIFDFIYPSRIKFRGWGMTTIHELPWNDDYTWKEFRRSTQDIKKIFNFSSNLHVTLENIDSFTYRHWTVAYCIRHVKKFTNIKNANFVECGVADGITAFFALRELFADKNDGIPNFYLFDAWESMDKSSLTEIESTRATTYSRLSFERTKSNLNEYVDFLVFHKGHLPESLDSVPKVPDSIIYLHVDINSSIVTQEILEFFYPKFEKGGIILFDDYGWTTFIETKKIVDIFFSNKPGMLLPLPTGQAIYFK